MLSMDTKEKVLSLINEDIKKMAHRYGCRHNEEDLMSIGQMCALEYMQKNEEQFLSIVDSETINHILYCVHSKIVSSVFVERKVEKK